MNKTDMEVQNSRRPSLFKVGPEEAGLRIDVYLSSHLGMTRSRVKKLIEDGNVKVLSTFTPKKSQISVGDVWIVVKPSYKVRPQEEIMVLIPQDPDVGLIPQDIPLNILYRDEDIVVVDKPPGIPVYPGPGHPSGTVLNGLLYRIGRLPSIGGPLRPGVVHRLDKDTSGVMVFALSERAYYRLVDIFKRRDLRRRYICLACGEFQKEHGVLSLPIGRAVSDRKRFSIKTRSPKEAITEWRVLERFRGATLLEVYLKTGRTHQIRVHLASQGHPVCGDRTYGRKTFVELGAQRIRFPRQMLHAETLGCRHPVRDIDMEFVSPIPDDMREAIESLRRLSAPTSKIL